MARMLVDLRHAVRGLARAPGYSLSVTVTLAMAIGACTAIFSAVHAVLLGPTDIRQPERLVVGWGLDPARGTGLIELTYLDLDDLVREARLFSGMASVASHTWQGVLDGQGDPERVSYAGVSGRFFEVLGVTPRLGRVLVPGDDVPKAEPVAVLSHAAWVRRYGGDASVIDRVLQIDGERLRIVGVMPEGFDYPRGAEFWVPLVPGLSAASSSGRPTCCAMSASSTWSAASGTTPPSKPPRRNCPASPASCSDRIPRAHRPGVSCSNRGWTTSSARHGRHCGR